MKAVLHRMSYKPVKIEHFRQADKEFKQVFDEEMKKGKPTSPEGWQKVNELLDQKELELSVRYPNEETVSLTVKKLKEIGEEYGPVTVYKHEGKWRVAILNDILPKE